MDIGFDTFKDELVGWGISLVADIAGGSGAATVGKFLQSCYSAYSTACNAIDSVTLMNLSKRKQAKFLLEAGFGWGSEATQNLILDGCGVTD